MSTNKSGLLSGNAIFLYIKCSLRFFFHLSPFFPFITAYSSLLLITVFSVYYSLFLSFFFNFKLSFFFPLIPVYSFLFSLISAIFSLILIYSLFSCPYQSLDSAFASFSSLTFFIIPSAAKIPVAAALTMSLESPAPSPAAKRFLILVSICLSTLRCIA